MVVGVGGYRRADRNQSVGLVKLLATPDWPIELLCPHGMCLLAYEQVSPFNHTFSLPHELVFLGRPLSDLQVLLPLLPSTDSSRVVLSHIHEAYGKKAFLFFVMGRG